MTYEKERPAKARQKPNYKTIGCKVDSQAKRQEENSRPAIKNLPLVKQICSIFQISINDRNQIQKYFDPV
jgi:hypothetical protein